VLVGIASHPTDPLGPRGRVAGLVPVCVIRHLAAQSLGFARRLTASFA